MSRNLSRAIRKPVQRIFAPQKGLVRLRSPFPRTIPSDLSRTQSREVEGLACGASYKLIITRRSVRLFKQKEVSPAEVKKAVEAARLAPSAANLQFLEYLAITKKDLREKVFPYTRWAGYLWPKRVPSQSKRPTLYIVILINKDKSKKPDLRDVGAAAENILLSLNSFGLGGCWIASIDRGALRKILNIPSKYKIDSLIAAGFPAESPKLENKDKVKYWLDRNNRLHVPKRPLKDIFYRNYIK